MIALDLETTDVDPHRDRIVTASIVIITPGLPGETTEVTTLNWLANPGVDIPVEATRLHGVTTEQAQHDGRPAADVVAEVAADLAQLWTPTTPLCAFNASYDLTMLDAELRRYHGRGLPLGGSVIDPLCIDRHLRPVSGWDDRRTLANVCAHYEARLDAAHSSAEDAIATARLAWLLAKRHPQAVGLLDLHELHKRQAGWFQTQENTYANRQERKLKQLVARGASSEKTDQMRERIAKIRASAKYWPLRPDLGDTAQPVRTRPAAPQPGEPANARASWTPELDASLREEWLAADPGALAETLRKELATQFRRTPGAIRSRLLKIRCDPELPSSTCDEQRAAELQRVYDAEYGR